jgi:hypothetical protein
MVSQSSQDSRPIGNRPSVDRPDDDDDYLYTDEEIDDMQTALHGFIMYELENEIQDANNNPYRWIYEVVIYSSSK